MRIITSGLMTVRAVTERKKRVYVSGYGDSAKFNSVSLGWFLEIIDYPAAIEAGVNKPDVEPGQRIWIEIHKEDPK